MNKSTRSIYRSAATVIIGLVLGFTFTGCSSLLGQTPAAPAPVATTVAASPSVDTSPSVDRQDSEEDVFVAAYTEDFYTAWGYEPGERAARAVYKYGVTNCKLLASGYTWDQVIQIANKTAQGSDVAEEFMWSVGYGIGYLCSEYVPE